MSWLWVIIAVIVGTAVLGAIRYVRLFFFAFFLAAGCLLFLHMQTDPVEGGSGLAALMGGFSLRSRVRRLLGVIA